METPINLLKIELENNQKQCEYYKGVDNNLAIQYKKRVIEIKRAIDVLERALAEHSNENAVLPIHSVMLSLSEVGRFGGWICDNWKRTSYDRWHNIHTYEMIDTIEELYERFKSNEA